MPTKPNERLASSLAKLRELQEGGRRVFKSGELTRAYRDRLVRAGFLQRVMKGWLISSSPGDGHDTTPWYTSFWEFCAAYCEDRFGEQWHLSPEQSILLCAENTTVPEQVVIYSPRAHNNTIALLHGTSLYALKQREMPPPSETVGHIGLRIYAPEAALLRVPESFYKRYPIDVATLLSRIEDGSAILRRLLDGGHSAVAGRIAGAFRNIGNDSLSDEILTTMKRAGYDVRERDPFSSKQVGAPYTKTTSIGMRLTHLWASMRGTVLDAFPPAPGLPDDIEAYSQALTERYPMDAYHSLSIEGYQVSPDLVERVRSGEWNPEDERDRRSRDALSARGYWQAFQLARDAAVESASGRNPGTIVRESHRDWYRELFAPSVTAGLIPASSLAGYRNGPVFIRGSRYVPPRSELVTDAMTTFFTLLEQETEPSVRAVLGHWMFGYIHPYPDSNGRLARFLMNVMLASGGYPWLVIPVDDRVEYLSSLEAASVDQQIESFAAYLTSRLSTAESH